MSRRRQVGLRTFFQSRRTCSALPIHLPAQESGDRRHDGQNDGQNHCGHSQCIGARSLPSHRNLHQGGAVGSNHHRAAGRNLGQLHTGVPRSAHFLNPHVISGGIGGRCGGRAGRCVSCGGRARRGGRGRRRCLVFFRLEIGSVCRNTDDLRVGGISDPAEDIAGSSHGEGHLMSGSFRADRDVATFQLEEAVAGHDVGVCGGDGCLNLLCRLPHRHRKNPDNQAHACQRSGNRCTGVSLQLLHSLSPRDRDVTIDSSTLRGKLTKRTENTASARV